MSLQRVAWRCRPSHRPYLPSTLPTSSLFPILAHKANQSTHKIPSSQKPHHKSASNAPSPENPSYPAFNFTDLGATRPVKTAVVICLTVVATAETYFWAKAFWRWYEGSERPEGGNKTEGA